MANGSNSDKGPISMRHLLAPRSPGIGGLLQKARALESLSERLRNALPETLRGNWAVGRLDGKTLVLVAESPAWATRLRYSRMVILQATREITGINEITELKIRITPPTRKRPAPKPPLLGPQAIQSLRQAARGVGSDNPRLREALERLARHGEGKP